MSTPRWTFLACSERSGSNLVTRLLDSHSELCGPSPTHLFRYLLQNRARYEADASGWRHLVDDAVRLFDSKLGSWRAEVTARELDARVRDRSLRGVVSYIYEKELRLAGKRALFVKENHLWRNLDFLLDAYPDARFVFAVRDPRDMALSWKRSANLRGCVLRAARVWQRDQAETLRHYRALAPLGRMIRVRYEDLLAAPEHELGRLCRFLGVAYEPDMLDLPSNALAAADASAMPEWKNLGERLLVDNRGKFQRELSEPEIGFVEACCRQEMAALGYEPTLPPARDVAALASALEPLERHDKPGYQAQPKATRLRHERRAAVVAALGASGGGPR